MKQEEAAFTQACFSISTHDGADIAKERRGRGRGNDGYWFKNRGTSEGMVTSSGRQGHSSCVIKHACEST